MYFFFIGKSKRLKMLFNSYLNWDDHNFACSFRLTEIVILFCRRQFVLQCTTFTLHEKRNSCVHTTMSSHGGMKMDNPR